MSDRLYTDEELCWATQAAYCNIDKFDFELYYETHTEAPTLQQIFSELGYGIYYDQELINTQTKNYVGLRRWHIRSKCNK